jgi:hypothetical protein
VETDARAPGVTGRPAPTGYTGLEGLLNYAYYQATAVNQFDQVGHLLHFILEEFQVGPCGQYNAGPTVPAAGDSAMPGKPGYVGTTSAADRNRCVSWVGPNQPGINAGPSLPPYSGQVCPQGSDDLSICNPANARNGAQTRSSGTPGATGPAPPAPTAPAQPGAPGANGPQLPNAPNLPNLPNLPNVPKTPNIPKTPNVPNIGGIGGLLGIGGGGQGGSGSPLGGTGLGAGGQDSNGNTNDLLNFLFGA